MKILDDILERLGAWLMGCAISVFPGGATIDLEEKKFVGRLDFLAETGLEGVVWILQEEGMTGYEGVHFIEAGNHLKVYNENGAVVFDDKIVPDSEIGKAERPGSLGFRQPSALGLWIHWTQQGWQPDDWAALFIRDKDKRLCAELTKKEGV